MTSTSAQPGSVTGRPAQGRERLSRDARLAVLLFFLGWVMSYADRTLITLALPYIGDDLSLTPTEQGLLISAFFITYALAQIPGGLLVDRFGAKRVAVVAILAWSLFTVLTGAAGAFAVMFAVRALFGLGEGIYPAASVKAVAERTTPGQRMTATGWMYSSGAVGAIIAGVAGAALISAMGWRWAFVVVGVAGLAVAAAIAFFLPVARAATSTVQGAEVAQVAQVTSALEAKVASPSVSKRDLFRSPAIWGHVAMFFGYGVVAWGLSAWVATYLVQARDLPLGLVGAVSVIPTVVLGVASVVGGRLVDALQGRHRVIVVPGMIVSAAILALLARQLPVPTFIVLLAVLSLFVGLCYMPILASPLRALPPAVVGTAYALISTGSQVGGIITPTVMGIVVQRVSWEAAFGTLIVGCAICTVAAVLVPRGPQELLATFTRRSTPTDSPAPAAG